MRAPRQGIPVRLPPDRLQNHNHNNRHVYVLELLQRAEWDAQAEFRRASSISPERREGTAPPSHLPISSQDAYLLSEHPKQAQSSGVSAASSPRSWGADCPRARPRDDDEEEVHARLPGTGPPQADGRREQGAAGPPGSSPGFQRARDAGGDAQRPQQVNGQWPPLGQAARQAASKRHRKSLVRPVSPQARRLPAFRLVVSE